MATVAMVLGDWVGTALDQTSLHRMSDWGTFCALRIQHTVTVMISAHLQQAIQQLEDGGIIAYPTEAVWGLGCDPANGPAVSRLLQIKRRPVSKGMILVAGNTAQVRPWLESLDREQRRRVEESWPGPFTWLLPDPEGRAPAWIRGRHDSVAVRVSAHPLVAALCQRFGGPIVSTSANIAGRPPARTRLQLAVQLGRSVDYIVPGRLGDQRSPSTIRDAVTGRLLRGEHTTVPDPADGAEQEQRS